MYVDILSSDNYNSYNIKLARLFGLNTAVYWSVLLNIVNKAISKGKISDDGYFNVNRKYIFELTTLSIEDQLKIDDSLDKLGVLKKKSKDTPDSIYLDLQLMSSIIANDNFKLLEDISNKVRIKSKKESKESQRAKIIQNLKDGIVEPNYDILTALRNWVDVMFTGKKGYLSKSIIEIFQKTLKEYAKDDVNLALRLIEIATIQGYRDCSWAISIYEKDKKLKSQLNDRQVRVTTQQKATKISDKVF